jgi:hypothetical protein
VAELMGQLVDLNADRVPDPPAREFVPANGRRQLHSTRGWWEVDGEERTQAMGRFAKRAIAFFESQEPAEMVEWHTLTFSVVSRRPVNGEPDELWRWSVWIH